MPYAALRRRASGGEDGRRVVCRNLAAKPLSCAALVPNSLQRSILEGDSYIRTQGCCEQRLSCFCEGLTNAGKTIRPAYEVVAPKRDYAAPERR